MKTHAPKTTSAALQPQKGNQPFFKKEGEGAFFSQDRVQLKAGNDNQTTSPFFGNHSGSTPFFTPSSIQTKLTTGQPGDQYEQEADAVAGQVAQKLAELSVQKADTPSTDNQQRTTFYPEPVEGNNIQPFTLSLSVSPELAEGKGTTSPTRPSLQPRPEETLDKEGPEQEEALQAKPIFESNGDPEENGIQRKCTACEQEENGAISPKLQRKPLPSTSKPAGIQRKCAACRAEAIRPKRIQRQGDNGAAPAAPDLESRLNAAKGGGSPLPKDTRSSMESAFGADFGGVRVHTGKSSVQMNQELGAQAFTHGSDIHFNSGKYDTQSSGGQRLLAHELTHVVQQGGSGSLQAKEIIQRAALNTPNINRLREYLDGDDESEAIELMGKLSPQEKDFVLSSTEFKELAVDAFWNDEMFEAIKAMKRNLPKSLEWMFEEGTSWPDVKTVLGLISGGKDTVRQDDRMKAQFIDICDNEEMAEAVDLLGGALLQKLSWMQAEGSNWDLMKAKIVGTGDAGEKEALYASSEMKEFFVSECDNEEMFEAVRLLGGKLIDKLTWMLEEGTEKEYVITVILEAPAPELAAVRADSDVVQELEEYLNYERELNGVETQMDITRQLLERRSVCGPDITTELDNAVGRADAMFSGWTDADKDDRCKSLISIETGGIAWDIDQLFNRRHGWILGYRPDCATEQNYSDPKGADELCGNTVQVGNQCFYAGTPNYIIFGKMMRLCYDHYKTNGAIDYYTKHRVVYKKDSYTKDKSLNLVWLYKGFPGFESTNYEGSRAFTIKGYDASADVPQGDRPGCYPSCPTAFRGPAFTIRWSSFAADREAGREQLRNLNR